jgi:biopolymer transport protein ExbB/TolQ
VTCNASEKGEREGLAANPLVVVAVVMVVVVLLLSVLWLLVLVVLVKLVMLELSLLLTVAVIPHKGNEGNSIYIVRVVVAPSGPLTSRSQSTAIPHREIEGYAPPVYEW